MNPHPLTRAVRWGLFALLAFALAVRLWHGSIGLDSTRYYDEQFSFRNVSALLVEKGLKPANAFYPSLSYLPQTAALLLSHGAHKLTGIERVAVFGPTADGFTRTAYFLCRAVAALFGVLSIYTLFLLGWRCFSPAVGLIAATLLAANEPHIFASAIFKPDGLVVWLTLVTFLWGLEAALEPSPRRFGKTGVGIGLAVAAKYTGVGVAISVVAGALWERLREWRRWKLLLLAGGVSVATFAVLNPFLFTVVRYIPRLMRIADEKAQGLNSTPWTVFEREIRFLRYIPLEWLWVLSAVGLVWLGWRAFRAAERRDRVVAVMILAYVVGYSALYVAVGGVFRGQNYLAVSALAALAAAFVVVELGRRAARHLPALASPWLSGGLLALLVVGLLVPSTRSTYNDIVPSTLARAAALLAPRLEPVELRQIYYERDLDKAEENEPLRAGFGERRSLALFAPRLTEVPADSLAASDVELVRVDRLAEPAFSAFAERYRKSSEPRLVVAPGPLRARGTALVAFLHPWQARGEPTPLELRASPGKNRFQAPLADPVTAEERLSLSLWLPLERGKPRPRRASVNGRELGIYEMRIAGRKVRYLTERFALPPGTNVLEVAVDPGLDLPALPRAELNRWLPP